MKTLLSLFTLLLFSNPFQAQMIETQLVRVDFENDNELTQLAVILNSFWPQSEYCFDQDKGNYIYTTFDTGISGVGLITVDVSAGQESWRYGLGSNTIMHTSPSYQYHEGEAKIYALLATHSNGEGIDFYQGDHTQGIFTKIATIDEGVNLDETITTIDPANNHYYLIHNLQRKIVRLSTVDGQKELEVPHDDNFTILQFDYNSTDNSMVGLAKYSGDDYISLIDIDPQTLLVSNPRQIIGLANNVSGMTQGGGMTAYDPENHLYFQAGIDDNGETKLFVINSKTAETIYSNDLEIGPNEGFYFMIKHNIEKFVFDKKNDQLLALYRNELLPSNVIYTTAESTLEVFPNPTVDFIKVSWEEKQVKNIWVVDQTGQGLFSINIQGELSSQQVDLKHLDSGSYNVVSFFETGEAAVQQVIKF